MSTRIEEFLRACVDGVKCALKPLTRVETLLSALNDKLAGAAPTVILEETELEGEDGNYVLTKPIAAPLVDGATYEIVFGGEKYTSKAADGTALVGMGVAVYLLGRSPNEENMPSPGPDCPFMLMILPDGVEDAGVMVYGQMDSAVTPDPPTLSIVEKAEAGSGGGDLVARVEGLEEDVNALSKEIADLKAEEEGKIEVIKPTWLRQNTNTNGELSNNTWLRASTELIVVPVNGINISKPDTNYYAIIYMFTAAGAMEKYFMESDDRVSFFVSRTYANIRICARRVDETNITIAEADEKVVLTTEKEAAEVNSNPLFGKKWAVCGDSFSAGGTSTEEDGKFTEGMFIGQPKVYSRFIAERNNMILQFMATGGKTLANPADGSFFNSFTNLNSSTGHEAWKNYQDIDEDVDYITFYFGINDSHHEAGSTGDDGESKQGEIPLGTIDDADTSTFYGAWNVMLPWLMENRPFAHMGILVSNGCDRDEYRTATIEIAKKWGVPYIDLNGDERTPVMLRSTNPNIAAAVKTIKRAQQGVSDTDGHPNVKAHLYESWFIEDFLRSL